MSFDMWTKKQAHRLAQTITQEHNEANHSACQDALEDYITAQLLQRDYAALFPTVAQHLDSCVACAASYALIYETRVAEASALAQIHIPTPDLSFLQPGRAALLQRRLAEAVERITPRRLRFTLSQALYDLLLLPQAPGLALRSIASEPPVLSMTLDQFGDEQVQLHLSVYAERKSPELCTLRTQLSLADREWPDLAGILVMINVGGLYHEIMTDPWGEAVFSDLPRTAIAGLQIEVDVGSPPQTST